VFFINDVVVINRTGSFPPSLVPAELGDFFYVCPLLLFCSGARLSGSGTPVLFFPFRRAPFGAGGPRGGLSVLVCPKPFDRRSSTAFFFPFELLHFRSCLHCCHRRAPPSCLFLFFFPPFFGQTLQSAHGICGLVQVDRAVLWHLTLFPFLVIQLSPHVPWVSKRCGSIPPTPRPFLVPLNVGVPFPAECAGS